MADTKISALSAVTDVLSDDEFVLARSGATKKIDAIDLAAGLGSNPTDIAYVEITSDVSITGSEGSPTDIVSAGAISFNGTTRVRIEFYAPAVVSTGASQQTVLSLWDSTTDLGRVFQCGNLSGTQVHGCYVVRYLTPSNASHTYKIRGFRDGGTSTANVQADTGGTGLQMPAFIRISRVGAAA